MIRLVTTILFICIFAAANAQRYPLPGEIMPRQEKLEHKYTSGLFRSDNAYTLYPMYDPAAVSSFNVFQYLQGRVPGLIIGNYLNFSPVIFYRAGRPVLFLDEIRVDAGFLSSINMNDVALIKVFHPPFLGSFGGGNGAIAVYTKNGDEE